MTRYSSIIRVLQQATAEGKESRVMALLALGAIALSLLAGFLTVVLYLSLKVPGAGAASGGIRFAIGLCPILGRIAIMASIVAYRRRPGSLSLNAILVSAFTVIVFWYLPNGGIASALQSLKLPE